MRCVRYFDCWSVRSICEECLSRLYNAFVQLFRILHIIQQFHMIFIHLVKIVKQNECISTFQELSKSIYYRNNFKTWKIAQLSNLCSSRECFVRLTFRNVCKTIMRFSSQINAHLLDFRYHWLFEYNSLRISKQIFDWKFYLLCANVIKIRTSWDRKTIAKCRVSQSYQI